MRRPAVVCSTLISSPELNIGSTSETQALASIPKNKSMKFELIMYMQCDVAGRGLFGFFLGFKISKLLN